MAAEAKECTCEGFLDEFMEIEDHVKDRSFLFILGAGASITSGIPGGASLARKWLEEYRVRRVGSSGPSLEEWATPESLGIEDFDLSRIAEFYPDIYDLRFGEDQDRGQAALEKEMETAKPDIGYSILAQILAKKRHKTVITTNFDNLVADALALYTDTFPLVCGHESLVGFVRARMRRPLVAKVHRDLLLDPKSLPEDISELDERWVRALTTLLQAFIPVVIGYGGNDGSLMGFLEKVPSDVLKRGIHWCYRVTDGKPSDRVQSLVAKHSGRLVPILGFDELMVQLNERYEWPPLVEAMEKESRDRVTRYQKRFEELLSRVREAAAASESAVSAAPVLRALEDTVSRAGSWWQWNLMAQAESDPERREAVYRDGMEELPRSFELAVNFAIFMTRVRKDHDEAERLYRRALELDPDNATSTGNFANLMTDVRKDHDEAERLYRRALELDPDNATNMSNFAAFMTNVREDHGEAERLYRRALELDPDDANIAGNFAGFLIAQGHLGEALEHLKTAWRLAESSPTQLSAEILIYWCLLARLRAKNADPGLARLKTLLLPPGYEREPWTFDVVLEAVKGSIDPDDFDLYVALAAAILDEARLELLSAFPHWAAIEAIPLDEPWDMAP